MCVASLQNFSSIKLDYVYLANFIKSAASSKT